MTPATLTRTIALVAPFVPEPARAMITGDALLYSTIGLDAAMIEQLTQALAREFLAEIPAHAIDRWLTVADVARDAAHYAKKHA